MDDANEIAQLIKRGIESGQITTSAMGVPGIASMTNEEIVKSIKEMKRRMEDLKRETAIQRLLERERERCAIVALAIDSGRGNEKEIAAAIRLLN